MADWRPQVRGLRYLWLLVPGLGVVELALHAWFATRAPVAEEWRGLAAAVSAEKRLGEPLVVAPEWAEPLARQAFGDAGFPLEELARSDDATYRTLLEVSALGAERVSLKGWRAVSESRHGRFRLRRLENPAPLRLRYRFLEHVNPRELAVSVVRGERTTACEFSDQARVQAGGLHGALAFPRERFVCPGGPSSFVGVTVLDDQDYRPRRCLWAHAPPGGVLRLTFSGVPSGSALRGFGGLSYFLFRDSQEPPVELSFSSGGTALGRYVHADTSGWQPFRVATPGLGAEPRTVELEVRSNGTVNRDLCFALEVVE